MLVQPKILLLPWQDACHLAKPLRRAVFVNEQGVPEELEWDEQDSKATHALALEGAMCIGTGRLIQAIEGKRAVIGRMAVKRECRGRGIGSLVMRSLLGEAHRIGVREVNIHAQVSARNFYRHFGFMDDDGVKFQEAGIAHVEMRVALGSVLNE